MLKQTVQKAEEDNDLEDVAHFIFSRNLKFKWLPYKLLESWYGLIEEEEVISTKKTKDEKKVIPYTNPSEEVKQAIERLGALTQARSAEKKLIAPPNPAYEGIPAPQYRY